MFNQIRKRIKAIGPSNSSRNTNSGCRRGEIAVAHTRCRIRRFGQRAITSYSNNRPFYPTNRIPFYLRLITIGNNSEMRRTHVTVVESISGLQPQVEYRIPQPTWSMQDLELTPIHTPINQQELERFARLVLVDVSGNDSDCDDDTSDLLKQDLGNMLHMIQGVTEHDCRTTSGKDVADTRDTDDLRSRARIYDIVRGVRGVPLRKEIEEDPLQASDAGQARVVWENFLQSKMIRRGGGHKYFAIETTETCRKQESQDR